MKVANSGTEKADGPKDLRVATNSDLGEIMRSQPEPRSPDRDSQPWMREVKAALMEFRQQMLHENFQYLGGKIDSMEKAVKEDTQRIRENARRLYVMEEQSRAKELQTKEVKEQDEVEPSEGECLSRELELGEHP